MKTKKKRSLATCKATRRTRAPARSTQRASVRARSTLVLPEELDIRTLGSLPAELRKRVTMGDALAIDGSEVTVVDSAALQLLIAARRAAAQRSFAFEWRGASESLRATSRLLGLCAALGLPQD